MTRASDKRALLLAAAILCGALASPLHAAPRVSAAAKATASPFALGIKRGDGMGNSPGLDVSWAAHSTILLSLAGYYLPEEYGRGIALAPSIVFRTSDAREQLVPFASFGVKHLRRHFGDRWGKGTGGFGSLGVEWTFTGGLSLRGGFGFHAQAKVEARDELVSVSQPGHGGFFVESGLRYWF